MPQLQDAFRDIATSEKRRAQPLLENSTHDPVTHLDVLIIGAGFSGVYQLHTLRDAGFHAKIVEAGQGYGGVWYWNRYPGARVDIEEPYYQFADPSVWKDWEWRSRFPGSAEIREYFEHVADAWDIRRDTEFGAWVVGAKWDDVERRWVVRTRKVCQDIVGGNYQADSEAVENVYKTKWLLPCTGFAAKRYFPEWKGIEKFQGPTSALRFSIDALLLSWGNGNHIKYRADTSYQEKSFIPHIGLKPIWRQVSMEGE